jgi:hypothetical protein
MQCFLIAAEPADIPHQSRTPSFYEYTPHASQSDDGLDSFPQPFEYQHSK